MESLGHRGFVCSAIILQNSFSKWLYQFIIWLPVYESFSCSIPLSTLGIFFILTFLGMFTTIMLWFFYAFLWGLMKLKIFSYVYLPLGHFFCEVPFQVFCLIFSYCRSSVLVIYCHVTEHLKIFGGNDLSLISNSDKTLIKQ